MSGRGEDFSIESIEEAEQWEIKLAENQQRYYDEVDISISKSLDNVYARRFLYEILKMTQMFSPVVPESEKTLHAEGKRLIGVLIKTRLDAVDTNLYFDIMKEGVRYEEAILEAGKISIP